MIFRLSAFSFLSQRINNLLSFLCIAGFLFSFTPILLSSIEVSGHLTEDTTWSPDNNPYEVVDNVFVDAGVTLTILPGTEVKIQSAQLTCSDDFYNNFWYLTGSAKMIWVDGRIIAEGTVEDSIRFTRLQDDFNYYWGCIYILGDGMPIFEHCIVEYSGGLGIAVGNIADAAITIYNGLGLIKHCTLRNNRQAFQASHIYTRDLEVTDCIFYNDNVNNYVQTAWGNVHLIILQPANNYKPALVAHNYFFGRNIYISSTYYVNNTNTSCIQVSTGAQDGSFSYFYNNDFTSCTTGIYGGNVGDGIFIKNNRFIGGDDELDVDEAYYEISDNYFDGCDLDTGLESSGKVYNNIANTGRIRTPGYLEAYNNISFDSSQLGIGATFRNVSFNNCSSINNEYAFGGAFWGTYNNCIFIGNEEITQYGVSGNPIFRNCILDFDLPPECIDGGGNIWVDSLQAQSIFEDIQNGDFHLAPSSIAIDAGFDTLGYYYPFDLDHHQRVCDGDGNGSAIIDIGPYEYGSPAFGGIQGSTYDPVSGLPVDYVLIKINNIAGEFTFSDSIGSYEYKLPAGIYDVYAERVFYDDTVEYQIEVIDEEFIQLDIPMSETVDVHEHEIPNSSFEISNLTNYPNPFNPETTIEFSLQNNSVVDLTIYNIKGQKITTLINEPMRKGKHSVIWSGLDSNNKPVSSGIYLYKIKSGIQESVKRMLLLK